MAEKKKQDGEQALITKMNKEGAWARNIFAMEEREQRDGSITLVQTRNPTFFEGPIQVNVAQEVKVKSKLNPKKSVTRMQGGTYEKLAKSHVAAHNLGRGVICTKDGRKWALTEKDK